MADTLCRRINGNPVDVARLAEEYAYTEGKHFIEYDAKKRIYEAILYGASLNQAWISVETDLPDDSYEVIASKGTGKSFAAWYDTINKCWLIHSDSEFQVEEVEVTRWMPMPSSL